MRKFILAFLPKLALLINKLNVLSRPVRILSGLFLGAYSVLTMVCALVMFNWPDPDHALAIGVMGLVIEVGAIWVFIKAADLVFGRRTQGGLIGATGLRVIAGAYALMMILVLTHSAIQHPSSAQILAAVGAVAVIVRLLGTAKKRQNTKTIEDARQLKA